MYNLNYSPYNLWLVDSAHPRLVMNTHTVRMSKDWTSGLDATNETLLLSSHRTQERSSLEFCKVTLCLLIDLLCSKALHFVSASVCLVGVFSSVSSPAVQSPLLFAASIISLVTFVSTGLSGH